jgi:hypothetical protein
LAEQAGVLLHAAVPGFENDARYVLARVRVRTFSCVPLAQICIDLVDAGNELGLAIESRNHDMTSLAAIRVIAVDHYYEPTNAVVVGVDLGHRLENSDFRQTAASPR